MTLSLNLASKIDTFSIKAQPRELQLRLSGEIMEVYISLVSFEESIWVRSVPSGEVESFSQKLFTRAVGSM